MARKLDMAQRLEKLIKLLDGRTAALIVMQDYPDPDAIAAAAGVRRLIKGLQGPPCTLAHGGGIGRPENQALARYTGLNLRQMEQVELERFDLIALVDTQPGTGNNSLTPDVLPDVVLDHHPIRNLTRSVPFTDIRRRYGAASTIVYEYLKAAELEIEVNLATALVYGIRSDTQDLGRDTTQADIDAYLTLYPIANKRMLSRIEHATVPANHFRVLATGLNRAMVYGDAVITELGEIAHPDILGEMADLLARNEDSRLVLCCGTHEGRLLLSLRVSDSDLDAGKAMRRIVGSSGTGGGHSTMAGGQISLKDASHETLNKMRIQTVRRFLRIAKADPHAVVPLVHR